MYLRCELVSDESSGVGIRILDIILVTVLGRGLGDLKQSRLGVQVPDLEPREVDAVDVVLGVAEIVLGDLGVLENLTRSH